MMSMTKAYSLAYNFLDSLQNALRLERLHDKVLCSGLDRLDDHRLLSHSRTHDHICSRINRLDRLECLDAIHLRHRDIKKCQIR